jgi:hypothetical protein
LDVEDMLIQCGIRTVPDVSTKRSVRCSRPAKKKITAPHAKARIEGAIEVVVGRFRILEILNANDWNAVRLSVCAVEDTTVHGIADFT